MDAPIPPKIAIQTPSNTLDVRGIDQEQAISALWRFIDQSLLRGELSIFIIHGHGTNALKKAIRLALKNESPYRLVMRPGTSEEGGDGVTVIFLK